MKNSSEKNLPEIDFSSPLNLPDLTASAFSEKWLNQNRYMIFVLNDKIYAVPTNSVAEVLPLSDITPLPKTPSWLAGIANLRGEVITVIDLFKFWSIETASDTPANPKLVLLRSENEDAPAAVAVKVDRVREVVVIPDEEIQKVEHAPHLLGKIAYQDDFLYLLDMEKLLVKLQG